MRVALREWLGEPPTPELAQAFAREIGEINRRRLRVLAPLMALVHVAHLGFFWVPESARATLAPAVLRWRGDIVLAHAAMIPLALALGGLAWRGRAPSLLGPLAAAGYLVHGAICTGLDQIVVTNVTAYIGYCIGAAVALALQPLAAAIAYAIGAATLVVAMLYLQESSSALRASLPNCFTLTVVGLAFSWILQAARRREFVQRRTIERQREELTQLNAGLEKRVEEAVAQLQAQVRARSSELSLALARLARRKESDDAVHAGTLLGGRFLVGEVIGEGGMGAVWSGADQSTGAKVAIKVIQATSSQQLDAIRRFIQEAGATATVTHPAVVRMLHVDVTDDGLLYQVQELVAGETLTRRLRAAWPPELAARLGAVLCDALAAAHAGGVVHRDVKPDNVMLTGHAPGTSASRRGTAPAAGAPDRAGRRRGQACAGQGARPRLRHRRNVDAYVREVSAAAAPGAHLMILAFAVGKRRGPRGLDRAEIERRFASGWELLSVERDDAASPWAGDPLYAYDLRRR